MILRNLLHIQENDILLIGSLTPPFFFRASNMMVEFIRLCDNKSVENALDLLKEKYPLTTFVNFQQRLNNIKEKLFVNDDLNEANKIDFSAKVSILTLNVTRKCNLKCSYCFEDSEYRKLGNMSFDVAKKAIDAFFTTPTNTPDWVITFTGGEPLLNYNLLKNVVEYVDNKGLKVKYLIKTNATLMDDEKMDFLIKNNFKIQISLDGNEKAHDTHRKFANGKGTFEIVHKNISKLIEKKYGSNITISGTLTHQTTKYIDDCYEQLNNYVGIRSFSIKPVMPNSSYLYAFNLEDHKAYFSNVRDNKYMIQSGLKTLKKKTNICGIGIWNITVDVDGKIYPCYRMCGQKKYIIGELEKLVLPFKLPKELENVYRLEVINTKCAKCYFVETCKTGCYTDKLHYKLNNCFHPIKGVIEDMLKKELLENKRYLFLELI